MERHRSNALNKRRGSGSPPRRVYTVRVFGTADRGMAMGHLEGKVAFIPFAAPGDLVEVEVIRDRRRHVETRLLRVLEPSPLRREPACPHFGSCGGCQWQHLPYPAQLEAKARNFRSFLKSRLRLADNQFRPPLASPCEWEYRNRVGLKVREVRGRVLLGFFARGSHRLIPIEGCPVASPAVAALIEPLAGFLAEFAPARGSLPQVDLQMDGRGQPWAVVHLLRPLHPNETRQLRAFLEGVGVAGAHVQAGRKQTLRRLTGPEDTMPFRVRLGERDVSVQVTPGGFVQANSRVNQILVDEIYDLASLCRDRPAVDLFCGSGNFTVALGARASQVLGVEGYPPAARDARENAERNGLTRVRVLSVPVLSGLRILRAERVQPQIALLDPPREGAAEAMEALADLAPRYIVYVSCWSPTLVRDLRILRERGYHVEWTRMADMFPQTAHVESLTFLSRRF